jgi:hypothetical protein
MTVFRRKANIQAGAMNPDDQGKSNVAVTCYNVQ